MRSVDTPGHDPDEERRTRARQVAPTADRNLAAVPEAHGAPTPPTGAGAELHQHFACIGTIIRDLQDQMQLTGPSAAATRFAKARAIGAGGFGKVYLCEVRLAWDIQIPTDKYICNALHACM